MKKKILSVLFIFIMCFTLIGCGKTNNNSSNKKEEIKSNEKEISVEGIKIKFDKEDKYTNGFKYKYSSSFKIDSLGTTRFYRLFNSDNKRIVEIRVTTSLESPESALAERKNNYYNDNTTDVKNEDKVFNDKKWSYIEYNNTSKGNNYKNHYYYYLYNKEYCIVKFIIDSSTNDISELEKEFMNNISFE